MAFLTTLKTSFPGHEWPLEKMVDHDHERPLVVYLLQKYFFLKVGGI